MKFTKHLECVGYSMSNNKNIGLTKMKSRSKSMNSHPFAVLLLLTFIFNYQNSFSQYNLPKPKVLVENEIRKISITKTPLRKENSRNRDVSEKSFDRTPQLLTTYFISNTGRIDSVYQYYQDSSKYNKHIFSFGKDNQVQEIIVTNSDEEVINRTLLVRSSKNEFHLRKWGHQVLLYDLKITADSIIYESTIYVSFSPEIYYTKTLYDFEKEIKSKSTFEGENLVMKETYQWRANNEIPYRFIYVKFTNDKGDKTPKTVSSEYDVAVDGSIMSENKGLFTDPFASINYFERFDYFKGIQHPFASKLRANTLVSQQEASEVIGFDGSKIVYSYSINYEKYK